MEIRISSRGWSIKILKSRLFELGNAGRLHKHPYKEIFIIQEGAAAFIVRPAMLEAHAGQIIILPAVTPPKFMNLNDKQLRQIDIHLNKQFITHWLEDQPRCSN